MFENQRQSILNHIQEGLPNESYYESKDKSSI